MPWWDEILKKGPPVTAEDWAHILVEGSQAMPDDIYERKHRELVEIVRAIQEQAAKNALTSSSI